MTGTVHAEYLTYGGAPAKGTVTFGTNTADQQLRDPSGNVVYTGPRKYRLVAGELTVVLPATDDTAFAESGWGWWARVDLDGCPPVLRWFDLPDGTTVELADVAPEATPGEAVSNLVTLAGLDEATAALLHDAESQTTDAMLDGIPVADSSTKGIIELATDGEAYAGTNPSRAITPTNLDFVLTQYGLAPDGLSATLEPLTQDTGWRDLSGVLTGEPNAIHARRIGNVVTLWFDPDSTTGNEWAGPITGLPDSLRPISMQTVNVGVTTRLYIYVGGDIFAADGVDAGEGSVTYLTTAAFPDPLPGTAVV